MPPFTPHPLSMAGPLKKERFFVAASLKESSTFSKFLCLREHVNKKKVHANIEYGEKQVLFYNILMCIHSSTFVFKKGQ